MTTLTEQAQVITINLGRTWSGIELLRVRKYRRKPGCRVDYLECRRGNRWRTIWTWHCLTAQEVADRIREHALLELDEGDMKRLEEFFGGDV